MDMMLEAADLGNSNVDEESHPGPWWFAPLAFPVIGASLGPLAWAFSVCALLRPWVITPIIDNQDDVPPGGKGIFALQAAQLLIAALSNLAIILALVGKLRYSVAKLACAGGYYISSICLAALLIAASRTGGDAADLDQWSQSHYYCLFAAVIYFLLACFLLLSYLGGRFWSLHTGVARTTALLLLLLNTVIFPSLVFLGALVFSHVEQWEYLDAVYWADVTLLTIGFGDIVPTTTLGRALVFPYAILGITCLGVSIASIRRLVLDRGEQLLRERRLGVLRDKFFQHTDVRGKHQFPARLRFPISQAVGQAGALSLDDEASIKFIFAEARRIQSRVSRKSMWTVLGMAMSAWLVVLFGGAAVFTACEKEAQGWSYFNGLYMTFISLTTIGYGDLSPSTSCARSFFVLWSLLGVPTMTIAISSMEKPLVGIIRGIASLVYGATFSRPLATLGKARDGALKALGLNAGRLVEDGHQGTENGACRQQEVPTTREQYCVLVLDEMLGIARQLDGRQMEHYSLKQWLWFKRLLRGYPQSPKARTSAAGQGVQGQEGDRGGGQEIPDAGLFLGTIAVANQTAELTTPETLRLGPFTSKSPLMGPGEEARWFLERLAAALRRELVILAGQNESVRT